ncbi:MAG TPA: RsmG family class I SAM-dependent methyltransferase [Thermoanaerobaculia bacterium]|nr:RsmG family class I SAM-dependent methyltransferase [Thermoanaerobaculia bacterium]
MSLQARIRRLVADVPEEERAGAGAAAGRLATFLSLLLEKNQAMNLVSARSAEPDVLVGTHLCDSLLGLPFLPRPGGRPARLLDLGSGGGFPAIPLLLVRPDLEGTLVESSGKKAAYLSGLVDRLALTARVVNARFPDTFPMAGGPRYDLLTTRAVGSAGKLVRAARPLLSPGARALLWTTEALASDAARSSRAGRSSFHPVKSAERRGLLLLECFT